MVETPQSGATRGHLARLGEGAPGYAGRTLRLTLVQALIEERLALGGPVFSGPQSSSGRMKLPSRIIPS